VIVPAFAVEHTQKFLFIVKELMESGQIPRIPVYCDSPMAIKAVEVFLKHSEECTDETCRLIKQYGSPLQWPGFTFAQTTDDSKKINNTNFPSIIVSSSGMVTGGRILHHLMQRLPDPRNTVIFIGFQAPGTRGAIIKSGAAEVRIFSETVPIRARKSRCLNNSAIMLIPQSCSNGYAHSGKSPRLPTWCMANRQRRLCFAMR
jgi:metallo-beta-lactamase family protein